MTKTVWILCGIAALLMSLSCHASEPPRIENAELADNTLELEFDQPMLTWTGNSDLMAIAIDPPADCLWIWNDDTRLVCSLGSIGRFKPATTYHVAVHAGLWSQAGVALPPQDLKVESQRPEIFASNVPTWTNGIPQIEISTFSDETAEALHEVLRLEAQGKPVDYTLVAQRPHFANTDRTALATNWRLLPQWASNDAAWLTLRIVPGLRSPDGDLTGQQSEELLKAFANEGFHVRRAGCTRNSLRYSQPQNVEVTGGAVADLSCPAGEKVLLEFSSPLAADSLQWLQSHLPEGLSPSKLGPSELLLSGLSQWQGHQRKGYTLALHVDTPGRSIQLALPTTLHADTGAALESASVAVHAGDFLPQIRVEPQRLLVPVGTAAPALLSWVNYPAIEVKQTALGADQLVATAQKFSAPATNRLERRPVPAPGGDVRRRGGLVEGAAAPVGVPDVNARYNLAYADFNLTASSAGNQVLAWVTDWKQAKPLPGTQVELLRTRDDKVEILATGTTAADGTVLLANPPDDRDHIGPRLLRATRGSDRAVLPLDLRVPVEKAKSPSAYSPPVNDGTRLAWGVSDRPLYRAGDTVHYRLWVRERGGNHLLALAPASLSVELGRRAGGEGLFEVSATPDRYGSVSGEMRLPANLRDDDYCLRVDLETSNVASTACFRVTGYHVNELWAELHAASAALVEGGTLALDASAGYFSGGPAAGAKAEFQNVLTAEYLENAYPQYAQFQFVDPYGDADGGHSESLENLLPARVELDAKGHAHMEVVLHGPVHDGQPAIPFGNLEINTIVSTTPASVVTSAPSNVKYSRFPRFVGLKVEPWALRGNADPELSAVVITAAGEAVPAARVSVDIDEANAGDSDDASTTYPTVLAHCELDAGQTAPCAFHPPHTGVFRFRASSPEAASTVVTRYAFVDDSPVSASHKNSITLSASRKQGVGGESLDLVLQQPYASAMVLVSIENARVLQHWVQRADGPELRFAVPLDAQWEPGVTVSAIVLDATDAAFGRHARPGALLQRASVDLTIAAPANAPAVSVAADRPKARPGETVNLRLRNPTMQRRQITLAVVDDAARALVPELVAANDPQSSAWLGALERWNAVDWYGLGTWPRPVDADTRIGGRLFDFRGGMFREDLETIVVTGSRISAADLFVRAVPSDHSLGRLPGYGGKAVAALRSHFAESALWKTDIELDASAETRVPVILPDNLTRWRVLAWSTDDTDHFALAEDMIEAALPIEVRSEAPTRLFPGDTSRIAASVRNHGDRASVISARLDAAGAGTTAGVTLSAHIAPNAQKEISLLAQPLKEGQVSVQARAEGAAGSDGVAASVEVASPLLQQHLPVAGWLPSQGVHLKLPPLPVGATQTALRVQASRGLLGLAREWVEGLRDYPHRCWEQILSRAVGAAAARKLGIESSWPDGRDAIDEALRVASQFQDSTGQFHFFAQRSDASELGGSPFLTAYTLRAFAFLRDEGYAVPEGVEDKARTQLGYWIANRRLPPAGSADEPSWEEMLAVAAVVSPEQKIPAGVLDRLRQTSSRMAFADRAELAQLLAARPDHAQEALPFIASLRAAAKRHGMSRVIQYRADTRWPFVSSTLDQCVALQVLTKLDTSTDAAEMRTELQRGFIDLYSGGSSAIDTQSAARCLMILAQQPATTAGMDAPVQVQVSAEGQAGTIKLEPHQSSAEWRSPAMVLPAALDLHSQAAADTLVNFVANIDYTVDGRRATPVAIGFGLQRRYSVLRDHAWKDVPASAVRAGDWVRVTLAVHSASMRRYVAITDTVVGGLRPTDLTLSGMAGAEMRSLSDSGSPYFSERKVDDRYARFYCEQLPAGSHEIYYYARAMQDGHYTAMPAVAELMYGPATVARTAATTIAIAPGAD